MLSNLLLTAGLLRADLAAALEWPAPFADRRDVPVSESKVSLDIYNDGTWARSWCVLPVLAVQEPQLI